MGAVEPQVSVPTTLNSINSEPSVRKSKRRPKIHLHTNAWRLIDSEFDSLNTLFSFTIEACKLVVILLELTDMVLCLFILRKIHFYLMI
jgi:hypothetical protein